MISKVIISEKRKSLTPYGAGLAQRCPRDGVLPLQLIPQSLQLHNRNNLSVFHVGYAAEFRYMENTLVPTIENRIFTIRGKQVMFDRDLAKLFEVQAKAMNQAVKRNTKRSPIEFMFQLDAKEFAEWRSQIVTSKGITRILYRFFMAAILQSFATWKTFLKPPLKIKYSQYVESRSCLILIYPPCLVFRLSASMNK